MLASRGRAVNLRPALRGCHHPVNRQGRRWARAILGNGAVFRLVSRAADA